MSDTPSYKELVARGGEWAPLIASMSPGSVVTISEATDAKEMRLDQINFRTAARRAGLPIVTRKKGGVLYAVYLKPEDVNSKR